MDGWRIVTKQIEDSCQRYICCAGRMEETDAVLVSGKEVYISTIALTRAWLWYYQTGEVPQGSVTIKMLEELEETVKQEVGDG